MQTRRALLLAASLGLVVSCDTADMSDPGGEEQEGTGVVTPSGSDDSSEGESDAPVNKIHVTDSVKGALSRGEATDLIVTLNATSVGQKSKISALASLRKAVMNDLAGIRANLTHEYERLPYMVINARDKSVLEALQASDSVKGVFDNEVFKPASTQVLTAINWTAVAAPGAGSGDGVRVVVLDSNVDAADFTGATVVSTGIASDSDTTGETSPTHGEAMVASILAVAPGTTVNAIDVAIDGVITAATVLDGLEAALVIDGATAVTAVNMSFEGTLSTTNANCDTNSLHDAIQDLVDANVAVVAAAGNGGDNAKIATPACDSLVISVGATFDATTTGTYNKTGGGTCTDTAAAVDTITCFSNYSNKLTLLAPGATVGLTWAGGDNSTLAQYGTSYSAAFVTGAIASLQDVYSSQAISWMRDRLLLSTNDMVARGGLSGTGKVLNVGDSDGDVCLSSVDTLEVDINAAGTASPASINLEFNKTSCTGAVSSGAPTWLTVTPGTPAAGVQNVTFAATTTDSKSIRYATTTCPSTTDYDAADRGAARCVLLSAESGTHDDRYIRVQQAQDTTAPSDMNASITISDGGDGIFEAANDANTATTELDAAVSATVNSVTDAAATSGFTYCLTTSSTAQGCTFTAFAGAFPQTVTATLTLSSGQGTKTVFLFVQDPATNRISRSATTIVDTQAPANGTLSVTSELSQVALSFALPSVNGAPFTEANLYRSTTSPAACSGTAINTWTGSGVAATGIIDFDSGMPLDGTTFILNDGANPAVTFEFDTNGSVTSTATLRQVDLTGAATVNDARTLLIAAVNAAPTLAITASAHATDGWTNLVNDAVGTAGNVAIGGTGATLGAVGMSGGVDGLTAGPLTFTQVAPAITLGTTYYYIACVTDGAGNTSAGATASARPRADVTAPTFTSVYATTTAGVTDVWDDLVTARNCENGAGGGASRCYTGSTGLVMELGGLDTDANDEYCFSTTQDGCTSSTGTWASLGSAPGTCASGEGTSNCVSVAVTAASLGAGNRTYYWFVRDTDLNVSASKSFAIYLDTSAPPTGRLTLTPGALSTGITWAGALDTGSRNNTYKVVVAAGATAPSAGCTDGTVLATGNAPATTFPTHNDTDGTGDSSPVLTAGAVYSYRVCLTDKAGNTNEGMTGTATIRTNTTGPVPLTTGATHAGITNCSASTNRTDCDADNCHWTGSTPTVGTCVANMVRLGGSAWSKKAQVRTWFEATDADSTTAEMEVCASSTSVLSRNCTNWQSYDDMLVSTNTGYLLSLSGDGAKYVGGWVRDKWGNLSDSDSGTAAAQAYRDRINVDRTAPGVGTAGVTLSGTTATITVEGIVDAASATAGGFARGLDTTTGNNTVMVYFRESATPPGTSACSSRLTTGRVCVTDMLTGGTATCTHTGLESGVTYSYRVCASDGVDNWNRGSTTSSITVP